MMKKKNLPTSFGVIGLGRFGMALVRSLTEAGKEVVAIDKDEERVKEVRRYTEFAFVGEALNENALREIGLQNCDTVIVCIGERLDMSILITMQVVSMGIQNVIAKATNIVHGEVLKRIGADVIFPERDMAIRLGKRLVSNNLLDYVALDDNVEVRRIQVTGKLIGASIQEIDIRKVYGVNIIAIERNHQTDVEFPSQYKFHKGDIIAVISKADKIDKFEAAVQDD